MCPLDRRKIGYLLIALVAVIVISFIFVFEKVTIRAAEGVFINQEWLATLSSPLLKGGTTADNLFVTNRKGEKVVATIKVDDSGQNIHVSGLDKGTYTLHINKEFIEGKPFKRLAVNQVQFNVFESIESVSSAEDLTTYFEQIKVLSAGNGGVKNEFFESANDSALSEESAKDSGSGGHSETNTQVEGVDEADIVKTDGQYIYSILGDAQITITDIRNPKELKVATTIKVDDETYYPTQLFLHEQVLIVLGNKYDYSAPNEKDNSKRIAPINDMTTVRLYDISEPAQPKLIREIGTEGYLNSARKTGDILYFVTNMHPNYWLMEELEGDYLRPRVTDTNNSEEASVLDYKDIAILPGTMEPTYSIITAVDLSSPTETQVETKGYLGGSEQLYMSKENLYLTATIYEAANKDDSATTMMWSPGSSDSEVFKFTLNETAVAFHSSAKLKGHLLNQFSMDEYNGYFRAVTTEGDMWDENNVSKNHLFIMDENMVNVGSVEGLAKGERIYSARFMGDKAYMVTFRETDPLFVIDVANPVAPKVLGELKIPGFSNYLHPLDENHLIGFGYETVAEKNSAGGEPLITTLGMKISLFDVTDFHNPKEQDTKIIGGRGTYSQVQHDHKSLFQHKERNLYGFPIEIYEEMKKETALGNLDYIGSGALIYEITPEKGIVLKGELLEGKMGTEQYGDYDKQIQRILYSNEELYTVSMKSITNYSLDTFAAIDQVQMDK